MRHSDRIALLMFRYIRSELTFEEEQELSEWRLLSTSNEQLFQAETDPDNIHSEMREMYANKEAVFQKIIAKYPELSQKSGINKQIRSISIAAAILISIGIGSYFLFLIPKKGNPVTKNENANKSILPGGNHALLTLMNGSSILLDSTKDGVIVTNEVSNTIIKKDKGQLVYSKNDQVTSGETDYNTLQTPRGGQYLLTLSDGTRVWLNAASALKYPTSFSGQNRKVELEGEAYFEVAKIINHSTGRIVPFLVSVNGKYNVEVLGTHFNIMAYHDEPYMETTLLEGSVKIGPKILSPGQQAQVNEKETSVIVKNDIDINAVVAWKNGKTSFKDASIQTIMRAISRWYDVEVSFNGEIPDKRFKGGLPRNTNLSELLKVLEQSGIHFTIEGKKIIVTP